MALLVHSGTAAIDLSASQTARDDISDVLMASLSLENNLLGYTEIGEEFAAEQLYWVEDALNPFKVTPTSTLASFAASTNATVTFSLSSADISVLDLGYILQLDTAVGVGGVTGDQMQVIILSGTTVTVQRNFGGATSNTVQSITSGTAGVLRIVNRPTYPNSDLGKDLTRARVAKVNFINRFEANVNIDSEQIMRSRAGYVPGVRDELFYQFQQRTIEMKRIMSQAYLYSKPPLSGNPNNDYQSMYGLVPWLDGTANTSSAPTTTAQTFTDSTINATVMALYRNGAYSNVIALGPNGVQDVGQFYQDRIRIDQEERDRGFYAQSFTPSMANKHWLVNEPYLNDVTGSGLMIVADLSRIRIRPFIGQFFYTIEAPTFRDGDAVRCLSKWSLEVRNSGADIGAAHLLVKSLTW